MNDSIRSKVDTLTKIGLLFEVLSDKNKNIHHDFDSKLIDLWENAIIKAAQINPWFTNDSIRFSMKTWSTCLTKENIDNWLSNYSQTSKSKNIAIIMAGNIPFVGFHDFICVWLSGHNPIIKSSSNDSVFYPLLKQFIENENHQNIEIQGGKISQFDAVIATGSDNSYLYFEQYFGKYPHIFRKNRTSLAIINGNENENELINLGKDLFYYFGLGCRNVSHILIPNEYDLDIIFKAIYSFHEIINHHKYANNYDYNKAIFLLNKDKFLDNGFVLFKENSSLFSPVSVINYSKYKNSNDLNNYICENKNSIQAIIGTNYIPFGNAQKPQIDEYADGVDTMKWLMNL